MPRIPTYRRQKLPPTNVGAAPISTRAADVAGGAVGQGLAQIGRGIGDIGQQLFRIEQENIRSKDLIAESDLKSIIELAEKGYKLKITEDGDTNNWENYRKEAEENIRTGAATLNWGTTRSQKLSGRMINDWSKNFLASSTLDVAKRNIDTAIEATEQDYITDPNSSNEANYRQALSAKLGPEEIDSEIKDARKRSNAIHIQGEYQRIITAGGTKKEAREPIETAMTAGDITSAQVQSLNSGLNSFASGRSRVERQATQEIYTGFFDSILAGQLEYDDIELSKLSADDKELWQDYIKGSYGPAPTQNTPGGHTKSFAAVYDAATLQLSPKEAYDVLLEARFAVKEKNRIITNEQFQWAIDKIENPYPKHILEDLKSTLKSNLEDFNRWRHFDKERNKEVNESLTTWVDELIKQDKVPVYDFKKKMAAMSSQFRVGEGRWYDIGQVIDQGGIEWEVVGFDENGEPLVEEVD